MVYRRLKAGQCPFDNFGKVNGMEWVYYVWMIAEHKILEDGTALVIPVDHFEVYREWRQIVRRSLSG